MTRGTKQQLLLIYAGSQTGWAEGGQKKIEEADWWEPTSSIFWVN